MMHDLGIQIVKRLIALVSPNPSKDITIQLRILPIGLSALCLTLLSFSAPTRAAVLFDNPTDPNLPATVWCDPCASGNTGYRVWDSFTLANNSTLTSFRWIGRASDVMSLGVEFEIAYGPYAPDIFSASYATSSISRSSASNPINDANIISLPNVSLVAGTYWLSVHGPSITEQLTWIGQTETAANGDNSLIQFGPNPDAPQFAIHRFEDARFRLNGDVNATPLPAALPLFATGLGVMGLLGWRRKRKAAAAVAAA